MTGDIRSAFHGTAFAVDVECRTADGESEPRVLILGSRRIDVREVLDRWPGPGYRYFKVVAADGATYILRRDEGTGRWTLTLYRRRGVES